MAYRILVGSYTNDIYTLLFEPSTGSLTIDSKLEVGFHPSWVTFHPSDKSLVFTGLEQPDGKVLAIKYDNDGRGKIVGERSSGGHSPCHITASEDQLFVANYVDGIVTIHPISKDAPYFTSAEPTTTIKLAGKPGTNVRRQEGPHAHQAFLHGDELLVADLGSDEVVRFSKDAEGVWATTGVIKYEPGAGPRHVAIHDGHIYTALELTNGVTKHTYPSAQHQVTIPSLREPQPFPNDMLCSEILVSHPYVYLSNRNDPHPDGDSISILSTSDPLEIVAEVRTGLNHLRGIQFGGEGDKWLVGGGANGGGVKVYERVDGGKGLKEVAKNEDVKAPTAFLWL